MFYLGIDLHGKQMTICVRSEQGGICLRKQVSTRRPKVEEFLDCLAGLAAGQGYLALLEVCGFHDWLVQRLQAHAACHKVLLVQPETRSKKKTDRRDANRLCELLWVNRQRLLDGQRVQGLRTVYFPTDDQRQDRQLTSVRQRLGQLRTRTINQIRHLLRRNNLEWERPTKTFQTRKVQQWLRTMPLDATDRWEMDQRLQQWKLWQQQIEQIDQRIAERFVHHADAQLLATIPGVSCYMAVAIASRIGDVSRFPRARSLANFFGITPGSRSSGETERLGAITKEGSRCVRFLLGQLVLHILRKDARLRDWFKAIKKRRGAKIARVAVMRRLTVIMWHMLTKREKYHYGGAPRQSRPQREDPRAACQPVDHRTLIVDHVKRRDDRASTGSSSLVAVGRPPATRSRSHARG